MHAAELIAMVSGKGIDLAHVAGSASNLDGIARQRTRMPIEIRLGIDVTPTVRGHGTRTYRRPIWSLAELGQAGQGVPKIPWFAAMLSYGGDQSVYWNLWEALHAEAYKLARHNDWAPKVKDIHGMPQYYRERLAEMVLDADRFAPVFVKVPNLWWLYLNITEETWGKIMSERYEQLRHRYQRWLDIANAEIGKRIRANTERLLRDVTDAEIAPSPLPQIEPAYALAHGEA
jgi:hypothetical protein